MTALTNLTDCVVNYTDNNMFLGNSSGTTRTTATCCTSLGSSAMLGVTTGYNNVAIGFESLKSLTTGIENTAVGVDTLANTTNGNRNAAFGHYALAAASSADNNTAVGHSAAAGITTGDDNVMIGESAGETASSSSQNVLIGSQVAQTLQTGSANIVIGYNTDVPSLSTSNYLNIGGAIVGDMTTGPALMNGFTATTQSPSDNSTKIATTAYVDAAVSSGGVTLGTPQATTSGTAFDFTGIPSGTKIITVNFSGVSLSGTDSLLIQIGDSGGVETSGYLGGSSGVAGASQGSTNYTTGFGLRTISAGFLAHGSVTLTLIDSSTNTWAASGGVADSSSAFNTWTQGSKSLSAVLDRVRITRSGSDTFDAGKVNICYQ